MRKFTVSSWLTLALGALAPHASATPVAYTGAHLIPIAGEPIPHGNLIVDQGKILAIGPSASPPIPADATIIDLAGKVVMPGLIDSHSPIGGWPGFSADNSEPIQPGLRALDGEQPLLITAQRAVHILGALRLAAEFDLRIILDGCAEAHLVPAEINAAGETENFSTETAAQLQAAGIPFAIQSGYEPYAPKSRTVLFEAGLLVARGLTWDQALASITSSPAAILGLSDRLGTLAVGRNADLALYDGDPFEYTTHCLGPLIDGLVYPGKSDHL